MEDGSAKREVEKEDEEEERLRQKKREEALEVQSLRRIISAYLNYTDASEQDVKRYERSYRKLPPAHKALLGRYPVKFQLLRRCITMNSCFIYYMLQAFVPPLDMTQDVECCEDSNLENNDNLICGERHGPCCQSQSTSGKPCCSNDEQGGLHDGDSIICKSNIEGIRYEEMQSRDLPGHSMEGHSACSKENNGECNCDEYDRSRANGYVSSPSCEWLAPSSQFRVPLADVDKVRCIIRNIVRDWAAEGQKERDECYKPILEELNSLFSNRQKKSPPSCLIPGAGLGRLALEISRLGFVSQGNEFSYYMMICSSFILNETEEVGQWTIHPWIHSNNNSLSDSDQLRPVSIPDIHPASAGITEGFSMCGGDFIEVYNDPNQVGVWDAVVTCFFIDTAHNVVEYIETIYKVLKDGGVWINLGPLLYHFADAYGQEDEMSIELSLEDVKRIALQFGFKIERETTLETTYTANPRSMMQTRYFPAFWTMRKKTAAAI